MLLMLMLDSTFAQNFLMKTDNFQMCKYQCGQGQGVWGILTFLWHYSPLRVGEFVLAHPDSPLHPWRYGLACIGVKWREATQPTKTTRQTCSFKTLRKLTYVINMFVVTPTQPHSGTYRMYMMTPRDHMSHDLSYFSGPKTSGAYRKHTEIDTNYKWR